MLSATVSEYIHTTNALTHLSLRIPGQAPSAAASAVAPSAASWSETINHAISSALDPIVNVLSSIIFFSPSIGGTEVPLIVLWLLAGGIFFTLYLGFMQLRVSTYRHSQKLLRGQFTRHSDPGEVTSFQALATELSGTVGLGNIAGVAVAITMGGPGAALWIIIAGLVGMALKSAEATLGVMYREVDEDGNTSGGPMYYLKHGLAELGKPMLGKILAVIFAIATVFGMTGAGNMFQSNQAAAQLVNITGGQASFFYGREWLIGVIIAILAGAVILGGISKIGSVTSKIVPFMGLLYIAMCMCVLIPNIVQIPNAFAEIIEGAFTGHGVAGGVLGVMIVGLRRAAFSNAAGVGTAGMAHSAVKTRRPATEGFVAMWEPFVDSVLICTMTALTVIISGVWKGADGVEGVALTADALRTTVSWFDIPLTIAIILFAFSTILSYSYYGMKAMGYLFGGSRIAERVYNVIYLLLIIVGAAASLDTIITFSDAMFFLMALPNILGMFMLAGVVRREIFGHRDKVRAGVISEVAEDEQVGMFSTNESDDSHAAVAHAETVAAFEAAAESRFDAEQAREDDSVSEEDTAAAESAYREASSHAVETAQQARDIIEASDDETGMLPEESELEPLTSGHANEIKVDEDDTEGDDPETPVSES